MDKTKLLGIAEALDKLISIDISGRGVITKLYDAARHQAEGPLTLKAVEALSLSIKPGDVVIIATGWVDQPLVAPDRGETDGPPGALALARALRLTLKARPIIVVDECLVAGMRQIARAAGFHCVEPETLIHSIEKNKLLTLSVLPFPADHDQAKIEAGKMIARFRPAACIAIERGGMNEVGMIHNMAGLDTSGTQAKMDYIFLAARQEAITTVAIGDGGNEIGMANIAAAIRTHVPHGDKCQCPCQRGLVPSTPVDVLVAATISNWGAYALAALLGASTGVLGAMNNAEREAAVLNAAAAADFHDAIYGSVAASVDGCTAEIHLSVVTIMQEIVRQRCHL